MTSRPVSSQSTSRADILSHLLDYAFGELFWISEAPNRAVEELDGASMELAERARAALVHIEGLDPDVDGRS